jgi:SAM-dependent methyltransferase
MTSDPLLDYYARRAPVYEAIYRKPERQADLARIEERLLEFCRGRDVLELACGTGYWTSRLARTARTVTGIDVVPEVLAEAGRKELPPARVRFRRGDVFRLDDVTGHFDAVAAAFLWSHIPRRQVAVFLDGLARRFPAGIPLLLVDNRFVEGSSTPIARRDARGDTWQARRLPDGSDVELVKNFPTPDELTAVLRGTVRHVEIELLEHYWMVSGETQPSAIVTESDDADRGERSSSERGFL